jgi:SAM-dependent methyltransferase
MNTASTETTPWDTGRFDQKRGPKKILFGRMYEDAAVEASVFPEGGRVLCIASAGCTAMALADRHEVVAVDINPVQLAYARERLSGAPPHAGAAERVMAALRTLLPLAGWTRRTLEAFAALDDPAAQLRYWQDHLDTLPFRVGIDVGLSMKGLGAVYASPLLDVLPPRFGRVMRGRMERCFARHPNRTNPFVRALLLGDLATTTAPSAHPPTLAEGDVAAYLEASPPQAFDGFTLSNILDGAPRGYQGRLLAAVKRAAKPDARVVLRSFAEPGGAPGGLASREGSENLAADDRSMLWGVVEARPVADL